MSQTQIDFIKACIAVSRDGAIKALARGDKATATIFAHQHAKDTAYLLSYGKTVR